MASFLIVFGKLVTLFVIMVIGYVAKKGNILSDDFVNNITSFITKITLPALFISAFQITFTIDLLKKGAVLFLLSFFIHVVCFLIGLLTANLFHIERKLKGIWIFSCMFSNMVFMGFPVLDSIFGEQAVFYCTFANFAFNILVYTWGIVILKKYDGKDEQIPFRKMLLTPINAALVLGLSMFILGIQLPESISSAVDMVAALTTPMAMIYIGAILSGSRIRDMFSGKQVYIITGLRLIVIPVLVFSVLRLFVEDPLILNVLVISHGMPIGTLCAIMAGQYGGDVFIASKYIFVSTLLSMITIPLLSMFMI